MLADGFYDVPRGRVATVVTHLEMLTPAPLRGRPLADGLSFRKVETPDTDWYRTLFRRVGAEDWLWFSRLRMSDDELAAIIQDKGVEVYAVSDGNSDLGLLELDFRTPNECELAFFGVASGLVGTGVGGYLMDQAIKAAWDKSIARFHVHTCTLDSPQALGFYIRSGFTPIRQQIEIAKDPRLDGLIAREAAPQIPIFD